MTRFPAIPDAELSADQRRVVEAILAGPRGSLRGPFVPLLRSPALADHVQSLGAHLRFNKVLPRDVTELAILVTARACRAQFEWHAHAPLAASAGVPETVIAAIGRGETPEDASPVLRLAHDFVASLHASRAVDDATFATARETWGEHGVIELTALCGYYTLVALILNVAEMPVPEGSRVPFEPARAETTE
jgi:4-carboxymuconolactone decarboxylase